MSALRLILVGGGTGELRQAARLAQEAGAQVRLADHGPEALAFARQYGADLILADVSCDVPRLIAGLRRERIILPVLACGVDAPATMAVAAVRAGAVDFLPLPPSRELIAAALLTIGHRPTELVGNDPEWRRVVAFAERFAPARTPILITGAAGTGRQMLARRLHALSGRSGAAVLFDTLAGSDLDAAVSELFGHRAGDFDGAVADRAGKIGEAVGGTLILRRAEALPPDLQRALPAVLAGSAVRLIVTAGARCALQPEFAAALSVAEVPLPGLKHRRSDIPALAHHFAAQIAAAEDLPAASLSSEAVEMLCAYDWPGNVAELQEVVHRAVLLARGAPVTGRDLVLGNGCTLGEESLSVGDLVGRSVEEVERALILGTLARCGGNRTSASAILGISVRTMRNKLRAFQSEGYAVAPAA